MASYEYRIVLAYDGDINNGNVDHELSDLGKDGWEIAAAVSRENGLAIILKRESR